MSDEDTTIITGHDARVVWRTVTVAVVIAVSCVSGIVYGVSEWVTLKTRVESLEKRNAEKDRESQRELWRRDREQRNPGTPSSKGGM